jgi:aminoglycoside phosphotransferase (APT) family kinase protein
MREKWNRGTALLELELDQLTGLIQHAFPRDRAVAAEFAEGGLANTNIKVRLQNHAQPILVRIFVRDPSAARKENAILHLIRQRDVPVPVPKVFDLIEPQDGLTEHPIIIMEYIDDASRFELHTAKLKQEEMMQVAQSIGKALAAVHSIKFDQFGFFDDALNVTTPITMDGAGLIAFAHEYLFERRGEEKLGAELTSDLLSFLDTYARILDIWNGSPCLTHSDFGPSNILVAHRQNRWQVAAILDWEFAFSGTPFFDFGNLLRGAVGEFPHFNQMLAESYVDAGGTLPANWRQMSLLVDLTAWLDFLVRPNAGSELVNDARRIIKSTITTCNLL